MMPPSSIPWSRTTFLRWSDFKAESNPAVFEDAHSTVKYRITWTVNSENIGSHIQFFIEDIKLIAEFFPELSWVRRIYATSELLKHEQGHFDLAELLRTEITKKISSAVHSKRYLAKGKNEEQRKQFAKEYSAALLNKELKKWQSYMEKKQSEYDSQTNFGQDVEAQSAYGLKFSQLRA